MNRKPTVPPSAERLIYVLEDDTDIACLVCRELAKWHDAHTYTHTVG
jgi:hypothetical protein